MEKLVFSDAKDANGKPMWVLMSDGSLIISQKTVDQASIRQLKLSA